MRLRPEVARREVDLQHAAAMAQQQLLQEKQGEVRAQEGFRERLRSFARQLTDAESLPESAMRAVVRAVRAELAALGQPASRDDAARADRDVHAAGPAQRLLEEEDAATASREPLNCRGGVACVATFEGHSNDVKSRAVLGAGQFRDREFKRLFNDYADNIYYAAGSTEANAYLLGGATPSSAQTTQYLLRNEALLFSRTATFSRAFLPSIVQ